MLVSLDESILDHVQGVVGMADHAQRERVGAAVIALEQRLERVAFAALRGGDQLAVIDRVTSMRRDGRSLTGLIHAGPSYHGPHTTCAANASGPQHRLVGALCSKPPRSKATPWPSLALRSRRSCSVFARSSTGMRPGGW